MLALHLKRFEFDFTREMHIKLNDRFEFPLELDMYPYTDKALAKEGHPIKGGLWLFVCTQGLTGFVWLLPSLGIFSIQYPVFGVMFIVATHLRDLVIVLQPLQTIG